MGAGGRTLFYHRVADGRDELAVSPARFRSQVELIARSGLRGVELGAFADAVARDGAAGRERAQREFGLERFRREHVELYERLLAP